MRYKQMRPWSPEDIEELRLLASKGISPLRIAVKMKRTQNAVTVRARTEGIALHAKKSAAKSATSSRQSQ